MCMWPNIHIFFIKILLKIVYSNDHIFGNSTEALKKFIFAKVQQHHKRLQKKKQLETLQFPPSNTICYFFFWEDVSSINGETHPKKVIYIMVKQKKQPSRGRKKKEINGKKNQNKTKTLHKARSFQVGSDNNVLNIPKYFLYVVSTRGISNMNENGLSSVPILTNILFVNKL
ncbi:hypothetical protein RFI_02622 [Reticulomyxa filosa]|uniref:Uncharacterized protein n=1 Tax=Reticulomyxa filosa TaxID=46433 RepID=X6P8F4_RETFI|nr:hypothetical protein RFI_02622 [Reticulomyxa filosa]|eukprot:ETO34471.1 hypothetical protein RFI_02622 [Reticulomyxa filosa]